MTAGERYLELVLRLGRLAPELIDSYAGPRALAERVGGEAPRDPAALADDACALAEDPGTNAWIAAQLSGLGAACEALAGRRAGYRALIERCYGVPAREVPEDEFAGALERLDAALPGAGNLRARYARWLEGQRVPPARLAPAADALKAELRRRTRERFGLPVGEEAEIVIVTDEPWAGYASYEGGLRSRIAINADLPVYGFRLMEIVAHEIYPGHHTEHVLKDVHLIARGSVEHAVFAYPAQHALVAEGIAMQAAEALLGDEADRVAADVLRPLGVPYDDEVAAVAGGSRRTFAAVRTNLLVQLDEGRIDMERARAYAREWLPDPDAHVDKLVAGLDGRPWPPYASCYTEGLALCGAFAIRVPDGYARLLREPFTTTDLRSRVGT